MRITKKELRDRVSSWDEIQHAPVSVPPTNLKSLPKEAAQQAIIEWFGTNFEDPVHSTPYISAEGGYQYIWGGPYDTRDIIENIFGDWLPKSIIENVISELENEGYVWVPNSARRLPPDDDFEDNILSDTQRPPAELHTAMLERLSTLSELLDTIPPTKSVGIGHNNPPDDIIDYDDIDDIRDASTILSSQPIEPDDPSPARSAVQKLSATLDRIVAKAGEKIDVFASEAAKASGNEVGKWGGRALIASLVLNLKDIVSIASEWLASLAHLSLPF